ncbi:MAG: hypothetical protein ABIN68_01340 [Sphingomicrobium sp.]
MNFTIVSSGKTAAFRGGAWVIGSLSGSELVVDGLKVVGARGSAIAAPTSGTTIDTEARTAVGLILAALRAHGLIEI